MPNIFFLYGDDTFASIQELHKLITKFKQKTGGDTIELDENNFTLDLFKHHIRTAGLFTLNKMIVIKNMLTNKSHSGAAFSKILDANPPYTTLVFFERGATDKRSSIFKELVKRSTDKSKFYYPEFTEASPKELGGWIRGELQARGKTIETSALASLEKNLTDRWSAHSALNKLMVQDTARVSEKLIEELIGAPMDDNIFSLLQAVSEKNTHHALKLLQSHLENGAEPLYLLSMIARQLRVLIKVKSAMIKNMPQKTLSTALKEHPYTIAKTAPLVKSFSLKKLMQIFQKIEKTDELLKTTTLPPAALLSALVFGIIQSDE